ncbi:MAG: NAD-dependent epimerase/dehydratase family protein [Gemmatimonadota bacterium]
MARVLVTGASGYLGCALIPRLVREHEVSAIGRREPAASFGAEVEYLTADLTRHDEARARLGPWRWDAVVNMAGPVVRSALDWNGQRAVLFAHVRIALSLRSLVPEEWSGRFLHISSMMVYGLPAAVPLREDHPRRPVNAYGVGKVLAEDVLATSHLEDVWFLRLPGLFSAERRAGALYHFMRAARTGEPIHITSSEPTAWDVLHVADAAEAIVRSLRASESNPGPVNVSYGEPVELVAIAQRFRELAGGAVEVIDTTGVSHPVFQMDVSRARRLLDGWPPATLQERLAELWEGATPSP